MRYTPPEGRWGRGRGMNTHMLFDGLERQRQEKGIGYNVTRMPTQWKNHPRYMVNISYGRIAYDTSYLCQAFHGDTLNEALSMALEWVSAQEIVAEEEGWE
jgi:hypothetical protein